MDKRIICPNCKSYERCMQMGWADTDKCVNFEKRDDLFDMTPLFESAKGFDNVIGAKMPTNIPDDKMNIPLFISNDSKWAVGKIDTRDLMPNTLQIDKCERVIFRDKTLDFQFEIGHDQYKDIDTIIVNGIKFKKEQRP